MLSAAGMKVPTPVVACEDASLIGAPFSVMEFVEGDVLRDVVPASFSSDTSRRQVSEEVVDTLVAIHALDVEAAGLSELAPPTGYLERQVRRWTMQWEHNRTRELRDIDRLGTWFAANIPSSPASTLVHGTYTMDNLIFDPLTSRAVTVVDWELATIGDPLADLGFLTALWVEPGERLEGQLQFGAATAEPGFLTRREIVERYMHASRRDVANLRWYQAFAFWKLAVLLEGSHKRVLAGTSSSSLVGQLEDGVPQLAARALRLTKALT
jgi:aminoglycoside phosphotransferase (APT) family kinase protein